MYIRVPMPPNPRYNEVRRVPVPELNATAFIKKDVLVLYDADMTFFDNINFDVSHQTPRIQLSDSMKTRYANIIGTVEGTKVDVIQLVWRLLGNICPDDHILIPLNGFHTDIREANLMCVPGEHRNYKGAVNVKPPDGYPHRYFPKGISYCEKSNKVLFSTNILANVYFMYGPFPRPCTMSNFEQTMAQYTWGRLDEINPIYQRMRAEYEDTKTSLMSPQP